MQLKIYFVLDISIENKQSPDTVTWAWLIFIIFLEQIDWCKHYVLLSDPTAVDSAVWCR